MYSIVHNLHIMKFNLKSV